MSNFLKQGKRIAARKNKKEVKHHTKEFYKILNELDEVAELMKLNKDTMEGLTEDNLKERFAEYSELEMGNLEKFILMGKLGLYHALDGMVERAKETANGEDND